MVKFWLMDDGESTWIKNVIFLESMTKYTARVWI